MTTATLFSAFILCEKRMQLVPAESKAHIRLGRLLRKLNYAILTRLGADMQAVCMQCGWIKPVGGVCSCRRKS